MKKYYKNKTKGFSLFIAVVVTGVLLIIAASVTNIAMKESIFANLTRESNKAFFAADAGVECSLYWDSKADAFNPAPRSTYGEIYIGEYSGIDTISPLDQKSAGGGFTSGAENELLFTNSVNTLFADELIFGWFNEVGNGPVTEGSGFTPTSYLYANLQEYKAVSSADAYSASGVFENLGHYANNYTADIVTFKAAPGQTPVLAPGQNNSSNIPFPNPVSIAFDNPSASSNLIIVSINYDSTDFEVNSVTDNKGNTYIRALGPTPWPSGWLVRETWYAKNITGGGAPIEITANSPAFVPVDLHCNNQTVTGGLGTSNDVGTEPPQPHRIGGGGVSEPDSIFQLDFANGTCAIVTIEKDTTTGDTHIESRGYNTCDVNNSRRVERGIEVTY